MLNHFKEHLLSKRFFAILIFGLIILTFIFSGVFGKRAMGTGGAAAIVNSEVITMADLDQRMKQIEQQYQQMFGGKSQFSPERKMIMGQALQQLISAEMAFQISKEMGFMATDAEVRDFILKIPAFQKEGRFQKSYYNNYLNATAMGPKEFEDKLRKEINTMRMQNFFEKAQYESSLEVQKNKDLKMVQQNYQFIQFNSKELAAKIPVSEQEVEAKLADKASQEALQNYFAQHKEQYSNPEQVKGSHILIKINDKVTETQALEKINQIKKQVTTANFAATAKKVSEDSGSKDIGGDLGFVSKGQMVPEFETALFSAKEGEIVGPVKSNYGYHLIYAVQKKAAYEATFEAHKKAIAREVIAETKLTEAITQLEKNLKEKKEEAVDAFVKANNLKWQETGFVSLDQESIPQIRSEQAQEAVSQLTASTPYSSIIRDGEDRILIKFKEKKTEVAKQDAKATADVKANNSQQKTYAILSQLLEEFKGKSKIQTSPTLQLQ